MKKLYTLSICCSMLFLTSSCSVFISTPRTAHIPITGLENQVCEYVIKLDDDLSQANLEVPLNERYALRFDMQWLNGDQDSLNPDIQLMREASPPKFSPWVTCNYRF